MNRIEIIVNGVTETVPAAPTIEGLIWLFQEHDVHLIVEHNNRFIYPRDYAATTVKPGDRIEFINPNFGG